MKLSFLIGTALHALTDDTTTKVDVAVSELFPFSQSDLSSIETLAINTLNLAESSAGSTAIKTVQVKKFITVDKYFGSLFGNSHRPNIGKGELLGIISFEGSSDFYWISLGINTEVRLTEMIKLFVSNRTEAQTEEPSSDQNCYTLTIDTREGQKRFEFQSNANNGEAQTYRIYADITNGLAGIVDDDNNGITINSATDTVTFRDKAGDIWTLVNGVSTLDTKQSIVNAETHTVNAATCTINATTTVTKALTGNSTILAKSDITSEAIVKGTKFVGQVTGDGIINGTLAAVDIAAIDPPPQHKGELCF